jgi:hypothetical protein
MATKSQQQFLRKLKQLVKSRIDRDFETLNRRDRLTASIERLWPKKSPKNTSLALPIQNECSKDLSGFEDWWEVAQTLRGEGKEAMQNCVAARDRQIGGKLAQVW